MKVKIITVILFSSVLLFAQTPSDSIPGFWRDNEGLRLGNLVFNNSTKDLDQLNPTNNENRELLSYIQRITNIFKINKALNPPMGGALYFYGGGSDQLELASRNSPKSFSISLLIRKLFKDCDTCKVVMAFEADKLLTITSNNLTSLLVNAPYRNDINKNPMPLFERWFIAPNLEERYITFPAEYTEEADFIFLSKINHPFGIKVTQEEFVKEAIRVAKKDYQETEKKFSTSNYELSKRMLDSIEIDMNQSISEIQRVDPNTARIMREEFEKSKKETLASLKAADVDTEKEKQEGLKNYRGILTQLENELASLSDSAKTSPAFYNHWGYTEDDSTSEKILLLNKDRSERISGLVDRGGFPVVKINPQYFNPQLSKTEIQLLVIKIERANRYLRPNEFLKNLIDRICDNLDLHPLFEIVRR